MGGGGRGIGDGATDKGFDVTSGWWVVVNLGMEGGF